MELPAPVRAVDLALSTIAPYGRPDLEARLRQTRARLLDDRIRVLVVGEFKQGKSSLVNTVLFKGLQAMLHDSRVLPGRHERIEGAEQIGAVINIDQAPIGRTPRSNPATYIGFYDEIRRLFAATPENKWITTFQTANPLSFTGIFDQ